MWARVRVKKSEMQRKMTEKKEIAGLEKVGESSQLAGNTGAKSHHCCQEYHPQGTNNLRIDKMHEKMKMQKN